MFSWVIMTRYIRGAILVAVAASAGILLFLGREKLKTVIITEISNCQSESIFTSDEILSFENGYEKIDDPRLVQFIQSRWISYPSNQQIKLNNPKSIHNSQDGQSQLVDKLLNQKTNGIFIECGAADGEKLSNSIFFERYRNWTGVLIEADRDFYMKLLQKRRNAYSVNACLSIKNKTEKVSFQGAGFLGKIADQGSKKPNVYTVQCFPLYSILLALEFKRIDYFSLDVEGAELPILYTIPWDKLYIDILTIEYPMTPGFIGEDKSKRSKEKLEALRKYFKSLNIYDEVKTLKLDVVFKHK